MEKLNFSTFSYCVRQLCRKKVIIMYVIIKMFNTVELLAYRVERLCIIDGRLLKVPQGLLVVGYTYCSVMPVATTRTLRRYRRPIEGAIFTLDHLFNCLPSPSCGENHRKWSIVGISTRIKTIDLFLRF